MKTLEKIIHIEGKSDLFKVISQNKSGLVVESLTDKKLLRVANHMPVNSLVQIHIYTTGEELLLFLIFLRFFEKNPNQKIDFDKNNNESMKALFATFVPDFDRKRVYGSHIKKIFNWYNLLISLHLIHDGNIAEIRAYFETDANKKND